MCVSIIGTSYFIAVNSQHVFFCLHCACPQCTASVTASRFAQLKQGVTCGFAVSPFVLPLIAYIASKRAACGTNLTLCKCQRSL